MATMKKAALPQSKKADAKAKSPIHSAVDAIFQNDDSLRTALSQNLQKRGAASRQIATRAKAAFANFKPSKFTPAERVQRNYLAPDGNLAQSSRAVVTKAVDAFRKSTSQRSMKIHIGDGLKDLVNRAGRDGTLVGEIDLADLIDYVTLKTSAAPSLRDDATFTACQAELEAERRLSQIEGANDVVVDEHAGPDAPAVQPAAAVTAGEPLNAADLVSAQVNAQMSTTTSPEERLRYAVQSRSDQKDSAKSIETFELRSGPSDVSSYHDFNSLQIAFEHVWTEIFHDQLVPLGEELFHEYVKLQAFLGVDDGAERAVSSVDDLKKLMADIRELSRLTNDSMPSDLKDKSAGPATSSPTSTEQAIDVVKTVIDPASAITDNIGDATVRAIVDPAGAVIDALGAVFAGKQHLNWSSFPGPLPIGNDVISVQFQENMAEPGNVEIVLMNSNEAWWWKGIEFTEFDAQGNIVSKFSISNDPRDPDVWKADSFNVLPLYTPQVLNSVLEFKKAAFAGVHTGYYLLTNLGEKLKDRTRVTFTWLKDQ